jgi:hypothetical protein
MFSKPQLEALSLTFHTLNEEGNNIAGIFWGLWLLPLGTLVIRSGFLPKVLGVFLWVAGLAYLISSLTAIAFPAQSDSVSRVLMPLLFAEFPIIFWLLIKGARLPQTPAAAPGTGGGR